ncbi:hypothetical protein KA517_00390 [Candidatus Gracilibacteria bacterium]|nr:hypothetical protein [Candidatus Gracilibacteria bacterium]
MISSTPYLFFSAIVIGSILEIVGLVGAAQWRKLLNTFAVASIVSLGTVLVLFAWQWIAGKQTYQFFSQESFMGWYFFALSWVAFDLRKEILPKLTESKLFLLFVLFMLTLVPYAKTLFIELPALLVFAVLATAVLFVSCMIKWSLPFWLKLAYSIAYLIVILVVCLIRIGAIWGDLALTSITTGMMWVNWVLSAALVTYTVIHTEYLFQLFPGRYHNDARVREHARILIGRVSDRQASPVETVVQLGVIVSLYLANSYFQVVESTTLITILFLLIPLVKLKNIKILESLRHRHLNSTR